LLWQRGHVLCQAAAQGVGLREPGCQRFGPEEVEDFARTRRRVGVVGKADDLARGLEQEAQGRVVFAPLEVGSGVARGLAFRPP